jgi:type IV pilus assembly protein PilB
LICRHCKLEVHYSDEQLVAAGLKPEDWRGVPFYEGPGCMECAGTGFHGRTAIHELLDLTDHIRELILERRPSSEIRRAAREEGMHFLREAALEKVKAGLTTLKEINKVTFIESTR